MTDSTLPISVPNQISTHKSLRFSLFCKNAGALHLILATSCKELTKILTCGPPRVRHLTALHISSQKIGHKDNVPRFYYKRLRRSATLPELWQSNQSSGLHEAGPDVPVDLVPIPWGVGAQPFATRRRRLGPVPVGHGQQGGQVPAPRPPKMHDQRGRIPSAPVPESVGETTGGSAPCDAGVPGRQPGSSPEDLRLQVAAAVTLGEEALRGRPWLPDQPAQHRHPTESPLDLG